MQELKVTLIQTSPVWENPGANLLLFEKLLGKIPSSSTDLIVLPEMFSTGFTMNARKFSEKMNGKTVHWMKSIAKKKKCVITGSIIIEEDGKYFNRLIWMKPDGTFTSYDKRHLFRYTDEHKYFTPGKDKLIEKLNGWKICPMICYDLRFPVWIRNKSGVNFDFDALIFVASWPAHRNHAWKTLLMARAIENQCYLIGVSRIGEDGNKIYHSGDSAVINPKGEIISKTRPGEESVETVSLSKKELRDWRKSFPASQDSDEFNLVF